MSIPLKNGESNGKENNEMETAIIWGIIGVIV